MKRKELLSWDEINDQIGYKLLNMLKDKTIDHDTYIKIGRSLSQVFNYLMVEENEAANKTV